jgi:hypothetical protein
MSMIRRCALNSKRREQLWEVVSPLLAQGEQVQVMAAAGVGTVTVKRQVATAVAVGIATGGLLTATPVPRQMYIAVTDRRILFFDGTGRPGKQMMELPRQYLYVSPPEKASLGLAMRIQLEIQGSDKGVQITFPHVAKADGRAFAAALGS